ncbi:hypothetical protein LC653_17840 [Nostoc sp. CHAB 5784]|uniref:hypothetical protein n=1 Tax=Nostoc mirabile TaxID=2907820 RepID=UPI001E30D14D|nr:hypothetical protein [Nostoc mirabile]MCC5665730.1 hypothetical protein [Nostoc mirabile CHAB5784]
MSTYNPECYPNACEFTVAIKLNVPIFIEPTLLIIFNLRGDSEPEIVISGASLADLDENSQALVSQIVGELEQTGKIFSTFSQTQYEQDKPVNYEQEIVEKYECVDTFSREDFVAIQPETPQLHKKIMGRFLDSLSDSFALVVNSMGTVLFLGKLANYTWE